MSSDTQEGGTFQRDAAMLQGFGLGLAVAAVTIDAFPYVRYWLVAIAAVLVLIGMLAEKYSMEVPGLGF